MVSWCPSVRSADGGELVSPNMRSTEQLPVPLPGGVTVATARAGASELVLARDGDDWVVRVDERVLMSNRMSAFARVADVAHVLVGGLGLGYTLRAALDGVDADARVTVAELVPEPTEAESMYAASGGNLQRAYPWSSPPGLTDINCTLTNYGRNWPTTACVGHGANDVGSTSPAGDGVWGQADLSGNVGEWALDWYASSLPTPCSDCANLFTASTRVLRGGSFYDDAPYLRAALRGNFAPTNRNLGVGVRCGRTP